MAAPRAFWKGYLRLSLVNIGVALHSASERSDKLALHGIHKPSGQRIRYEKVAEGVGPVDADDIVKGFRIGKDSYVLLEPEEVDEIKIESKHTIDLVQFVDVCEIDPRYFDRPYYVTPNGEESEEGFVVIRDALRSARKIGIGQLAMRGRESLVALQPCGRGLLLETLRYAEEVRDSDAVFDEIPDLKPDKELTGLAEELIERKAKPFDAAAFKDSYADALRELIERKREGRSVVTSDKTERRGGQVIDLMEALKKSVKAGGAGAAGGKTRAAAKRVSASRKTSSRKAPSRKKAG